MALQSIFLRVYPELALLEMHRTNAAKWRDGLPLHELHWMLNLEKAFHKTRWMLDKRERFSLIYEILRRKGLLPTAVPKAEKSGRASEGFKAAGNSAWADKNDMEAIRMYTKAVCAAVPGSKEMALAYGNRSAVTFNLKEYNDSIRDIEHALSSGYPTDKMHKLYERRGKCFQALLQHSKAVEDFKLAKVHLCNSGHDEASRKCLISRIDNLMKLSSCKTDCPQQSSDSPKLSHEPSPYIQSASAAVDIKYSPEMGRHVVATTDIKPGELLSIEKPYVSALGPVHYNFFCNNCLKRCHSSIPCTACTEVVYCSEECRQVSWRAYHSFECDILPTLKCIFGSEDSAGYMELRVLLKATQYGANLSKFVDDCFKSRATPTFGRGKKYRSDDYNSVCGLLTHEGSQGVASDILYEITAACLVHILKEQTNYFSCSGSNTPPSGGLNSRHVAAARMLVIYSMQQSCNAHAVSETQYRPPCDKVIFNNVAIGTGLYPFHSLTNHSCEPNATRFFIGDQLYLFAVQPIKKGQQIFDSYKYLYSHDPLSVRQTALKTKYFFTCTCAACVEDWPLLPHLPDANPPYLVPGAEMIVGPPWERVKSIINDAKEGIMSEDQLKIVIQYLTVINELVHRAWKPYLMCQLAIKCFLSLKTNHYVFPINTTK